VNNNIIRNSHKKLTKERSRENSWIKSNTWCKERYAMRIQSNINCKKNWCKTIHYNNMQLIKRYGIWSTRDAIAKF
jgi:hypothetical protein